MGVCEALIGRLREEVWKKEMRRNKDVMGT